MVQNLTKIGVKANEARISERTEIDYTKDPPVTVAKVLADVGYTVQTQEGEEIRRDYSIELSGARKTTAQRLLQNLTADIRAKEGIP